VDCQSFDEQVVRRDPKVQKLLDQFVCVRIVQANGMDLTLFQFDYDLTFAAFMLNADRTIYGRYASRTGRRQTSQGTGIESFGKALTAALELHRGYPANKSSLAGKQPLPVSHKIPEDYPTLAARFGRPAGAGVVADRNCIHCHQISQAQKKDFEGAKRDMPLQLKLPYPMPEIFGLGLDPKEKAKVSRVWDGTSAARDGFKVGDEILTLDGQPMISIADVQWVTHNAKPPAQLKAEVLRAGKRITLPITLASDWRKAPR
jgi:hypothetical protein